MQAIDALTGYKILNSIKPYHLNPQFPYSELTPEKATQVEEFITVISATNSGVRGGVEKINQITFYE